MFPSPRTLLSLILVTLTVNTVDARPLGRTTGKRILNFVTRFGELGSRNIVENDLARVQTMKQAGRLGSRSTSFTIENGNIHYTAQVGVGSPPTDYTLLIDTGSSNTWVGANKPFVETGTSQDTGHTVFVSYGSGNFTGEEWIDTVTLASDLVINGQSIGVASSSSGLDGLDGILGVGPVDLTSGTVSGVDTVPTVTDNLFSQGTISEDVLGIYFIPAADPSKSGELTFGGYDESAITTPVSYVPLTGTSPASHFWGIDQSITYGGTTILASTAGIVDTGTTLILIATDAFKQYQSVTGGVLDSATSLLKITPDQYAALKPLEFNIGGSPFALSPNAQIWPRSLNTEIGGVSDAIYLIVSDIKSQSGSGMDFVNGFAFLERYYSVHDTANGRMGFAETKYTSSDIN